MSSSSRQKSPPTKVYATASSKRKCRHNLDQLLRNGYMLTNVNYDYGLIWVRCDAKMIKLRDTDSIIDYGTLSPYPEYPLRKRVNSND